MEMRQRQIRGGGAQMAHGGGGGTLSPHERDYKTHILYLMPDDMPSKKAHGIACALPGILVVNLASVPANQRPRYVRGVPTLEVQGHVPRIFVGTQALVELERLRSEQLQNSVGGDKSIGFDYNSENRKASMSAVGCAIEPILDDDSKYGGQTKIKDGDIEKLKSRRANLPDPRLTGGSAGSP